LERRGAWLGGCAEAEVVKVAAQAALAAGSEKAAGCLRRARLKAEQYRLPVGCGTGLLHLTNC
jgi:hypothetical protein